MQQYLAGQIFRIDDDNTRKRHASDTVDQRTKRLKFDIDGRGTPVPSVLTVPPLPEGQISLATVFDLSNDNALASFDVTKLPVEMVHQIILATLMAASSEQLASSLDVRL